jgi:hypothetical protein
MAMLGFVAVPSSLHAQFKNSGEVVKITATAGQIDDQGKQQVTITVTIPKGWHIYANPVEHMDLAEAATVVAIGGKTKLTSVKVTYPPGKEVMNDVIGNYRIYEDKVVITAEVVRAKGDAEPLKASVKVQAVRPEGFCVLPSTEEIDVK